MVGKIFVFVGLILIGVAGVVFFTIDNSRVTINHVTQPFRSLSANTQFLIKYGVAGGLAGLGSLFFLGGLIGIFRGAKQARLLALIAQTGIAADATVTFVDKNFSLLVNQRPIYAIVEYKFLDASGNERVRRIDNVSAELAIRNKIEVGGTVKIKYLQENPAQSVLLLESR